MKVNLMSPLVKRPTEEGEVTSGRGGSKKLEKAGFPPLLLSLHLLASQRKRNFLPSLPSRLCWSYDQQTYNQQIEKFVGFRPFFINIPMIKEQ